MKTRILNSIIVFTIFVLPSAFGQGALAPPGAPAPTMKTLAQIEPRTPISSVPLTITSRGSYYLTTNLTVSSGNAITIVTNGVTLDLNGFTISSTEASPAGVAIVLNFIPRDITIVNGHIRGGVTNNGSGAYSGPGFATGIVGAPVNTVVSHVTVSGCLNDGISLGSGDTTLVESCAVKTVGHFGIWAATVKQSSALDCGNNAIICDEASDCRGQSSGGGVGISAFRGALNSYGESSSSTGLSATTAQNCWGVSSNGTGLGATTAQNCYGTSTTDTGLNAYTAQNCYGYTSGSGNGINVSALASGCYGVSSSGIGVSAIVANNCVASRPGGTAILATNATGCYAISGTNNIINKYNMP